MFKLILSALSAGVLVCAAPAQAAAPAPAADQGRPIVIGRAYDLASATLKETRRINVYLPPGYPAAGKAYPVVYLIDGGEDEDFPHIAGLAQLGALGGAYREMIVVGVAGADRKRDLTYPSGDPRDRKDLPTSGGSAAFRRFLTEELQPWVKARYPAGGETALMGESLAGLFVVETFLRQPGAFDAYIAVSPSLWWDNGRLAKGSAALLAAQPPGRRALFLSIGDEGREMQAGVDDLTAALRAKPPEGLTWRYQPMPAEHHNSIYHPAALAAFRALFAEPAGR
ncbi:esterase [Caulobacter sp. CCUG 60055]|uniref:alpha/beta hydrolase n=1 Tax=Caulobacter sp. CCUG 60055 TaxID=2100090 RepID=UPI001FA7A5C8|nr:alpha/beta hydrolase-fold protein [Caulobacter sp. CCUG 60055]MCI3181382.1 esterase [Caulobacter sp. CCUG 60055]